MPIFTRNWHFSWFYKHKHYVRVVSSLLAQDFSRQRWEMVSCRLGRLKCFVSRVKLSLLPFCGWIAGRRTDTIWAGLKVFDSFYLIYINDITRITKNMELRLYADDTTGYVASNSPATLEFYINSDLARLSQWLEDNYLTIHATKTQAMIVGKSNYNYELTLKSNNILTIDELKLLGVPIDNKLTFSSHIKLVLSKIHANIATLRRIRNFIDSDTALKLYKSYILPHFDYCSPLLIAIIKLYLIS